VPVPVHTPTPPPTHIYNICEYVTHPCRATDGAFPCTPPPTHTDIYIYIRCLCICDSPLQGESDTHTLTSIYYVCGYVAHPCRATDGASPCTQPSFNISAGEILSSGEIASSRSRSRRAEVEVLAHCGRGGGGVITSEPPG